MADLVGQQNNIKMTTDIVGPYVRGADNEGSCVAGLSNILIDL